MIFVMTAGYAAFSIELNISVKGNIVKTAEECFTVTDNGDGTGTVTDYDISCGLKVVIPDVINNLTITKIGDAIWDSNGDYSGSLANKNITYLKLPNTLIEVGIAAFFNNKLTSLVIPDGVITINDQAFRANKIADLKLPNTLKEIKQWAFHNNNLTEINIPESVTTLGDGSFTKNLVSGDARYIYGRNSDGSINYERLVSFAGNNATGTTIPDTVTIIGTSAYEQVKYNDVVIPERIKWIGSHAFQESNIMNDINISENISLIGNQAFAGNPNLKVININRKEGSFYLGNNPFDSNTTVNYIGTN